jgi:hypothetical protein
LSLGGSIVLTIRCGGEPPEVELAATPADFERLAASVDDLVASDAAEILVEAAAPSPEPYERCLFVLRIAKAAAPLSVSVAATMLSISGHPAALALFARNLPVEPALPVGYHVHFEPTGREDQVSPGSTPLVLCVAGIPAA